MSVSSETEISLSSLPLNIQNKIPYSIRTKKDTYPLKKLPKNIQYYITEYYRKQVSFEYDILFDVKPYPSKIEDFESIQNYYDLVVEYLKNYLQLSRGQYPFDPSFYSRLKTYVQTKDTSTQYTLVSNELNRIVRIISTDLNIPVELEEMRIDKSNKTDVSITYNLFIQVKVNNMIKEMTVSL